MCGSVMMLSTWGFRRVLNSSGRAIQPSVGTTVWIHKDIWALEDWQVSATEIQLYYYPLWSLGDQESPEALYWLIFRICCTVFQTKSWCITDPSHYNSKVILTQLSRRLTKEPVLGRGTKLLRFAPELPNVGMQPMLWVPVHPAREEDLHTFPLCSNNCQYGTVTGYHWHRLQAFLCKCTYLTATDSLSPSLGYRKTCQSIACKRIGHTGPVSKSICGSTPQILAPLYNLCGMLLLTTCWCGWLSGTGRI